MVTSYHSFHFETIIEAIALRVHKGCGLHLTLPHFFTTNHYKSEHPRKFYPRKIPVIQYKESFIFAVCIFTYHQLTKIQMLIHEITHGDSCNKYIATNAITFTENYGELHAANECSRSIYNLLTLPQLLFFFASDDDWKP